jgi:hypothetical protein
MCDLIDTKRAAEILGVETTHGVTHYIRRGVLIPIGKIGVGYLLRRVDVVALKAKMGKGKNKAKLSLKK